MSRFEKFASEKDVIRRIEQLRADGYTDTEITVISEQKLEDAYLKYRDVNFKDSEGTTWDKFVSMFSDAEPKDKVLADFDITDSEKEHFKHALDRKEILLLKESYDRREESQVTDTTREFHETQQQDAQGMESEVEQNTRLDAEKEVPKQESSYSYNHGTASEQDRLHTAEDDDRFDSLHSSKASSRGAGGTAPGGSTYVEQAERALREDITLDADRSAVEQDNEITLKDTSNDNEYDYRSTGSDSSRRKRRGRGNAGYDYTDNKEYSYDRRPKGYDYKK